MNVPYFKDVSYDDILKDIWGIIFLLHSLFFYLGASLTIRLSGVSQKEEGGFKGAKNPRIRWIKTILQKISPPGVLYTLLLLVGHLILVGAAATYYTGPGGPFWIYPSLFFIPIFVIWIGGLSYIARSRSLSRNPKVRSDSSTD